MPINRRVKRRLILLTVLLAVLATVLAGLYLLRNWSTARQVETRYRDGMAAYEAGDYVSALDDLSYAVTHRRDDVALTLAFADTRLRNRDETNRHILGAIKIYQHVLTVDPGNEEAIRGLLRIYMATGRTAETLLISRKLPENDREGILARIHVLRMAERLKDALQEVVKLRDLEPNETDWPLIEFQIRVSLEQPPHTMLTALEEYKEQYPNNQAIAILRVPVLRNANQSEDAILLARELANLPEVDLKILFMLHQQLEELGLHDEADQVLQQARESADDDPTVAFTLVDRSWRRGELTEARRQAQAATEHFPDDLKFYRYDAMLAALDRGATDMEESNARLLEASMKQDTARAQRDALLIEGLRAYSSSNTNTASLQSAQDAVATALSNNQNSQILLYLKAVLLEREGQSNEALLLFERIFRGTDSRLAGYRLVDGLMRQQRPLDALPHASRLLRHYPTQSNFALRARVWIAIAQSGRDPIVLDTMVQSGSTMTQEIRRAYAQIEGTNPRGAVQLLPLLAQAALLEGNRNTYEYARSRALAIDFSSPEDLLALARIDRQLDDGDPLELLDAAEDHGASPFEIELFRAESIDDQEERDASISALLQIVDEIEEGTGERTNALRRVLPLAAMSLSSDGSSTEFLSEIYSALRNDATSARIILAYPGIWNRDPALADDALAQLRVLVGEDAPAYLIANARRIAATASDDPAARSQAIMSLDGVLRRSPGSVDAMLLMANLLQSGDEPDLARAAGYLRSALDVRPNQVALYPRLIELLQQIGDRSGALDYLQRYQKVASNDSNAARARVALFLRQGELAQATEQLTLIASESNDPLDRIALAQLLVQQGREQDALREYDAVLAVDSENKFAIHGKALLFASLGNVDEALNIIDSTASIEPEDRTSVRIQILISSGRLEAALQELDILIDLAPDQVATWTIAADLKSRTGDTAGTRAALSQALRIDPLDATALNQLAPILVSDPATWPDARKLIERMAAVSPARARSLTLVMDASDPATGIIRHSPEHLHRAIALVEEYPNSIEAWRLNWLLHSTMGEHEKALEIARIALNTIPSTPLPAQWGVRSAIYSGLWEEAIQLGYAGRKRLPPNARLEAELQIAALCLHRGRNSEASMVLDRYIPILFDDDAIYAETTRNKRITEESLPPGQKIPSRLRVQVMSALLAEGKVDRAFAIFGSSFEDKPALLEAWLVATPSIKPDDARAGIQIVSPLLRQSPRGQFRLAQAWLTLADKTSNPQDISQAQMALDEAVASEELDARALSILKANILSTSGDWDESMKVLRQTLDLYTSEELDRINRFEDLPPDEQRMHLPELASFVMTLNNLAYAHMLVDQSNLDEAVALINSALAAAPSWMAPELLDTKASILTKQGSHEEASAALSSATGLAPHRTDFHLRLVRIMILEDRRSEAATLAEETLTKLLDAPQPDLKQIEEAKMLIKELDQDREASSRIEKIG